MTEKEFLFGLGIAVLLFIRYILKDTFLENFKR